MSQYKTYFNWSTGKDAALALYYLKQDSNYNIAQLITSVNSHFDRVSMHGLRRELLEKQIESLDITSSTIELPEQPTMEEYETAINECVLNLKSNDFTHSAFGDIFLEDLKDYRVKQLNHLRIKTVFPLWQKDTKELIKKFLSLGFKAIIVCIKSDLLDVSFAGREIDENFLDDLPDNVDACGENGEFHTFCYDGPIFSKPIDFVLGEKVFKKYKNPDNSQNKKSLGFWFQDLVLTVS